MIEVDNFGIVTHTHLILLHAYKQIFITKFLTKFRKNKVWKNRFWKNKFLEKQSLFRKRIFYQNKVQIILVLIYDHTLVLISPKTLFCIYPSKEFLSKISIFKKPFEKSVFRPSPVDRAVDRWQS